MTPPDGLAEQRQVAVAAFLVAEDAPVDAVLEGRAVGRQAGFEGERAGADVAWRAGVGRIRRGLADIGARIARIDGIAVVEIAAVAIGAEGGVAAALVGRFGGGRDRRRAGTLGRSRVRQGEQGGEGAGQQDAACQGSQGGRAGR